MKSLTIALVILICPSLLLGAGQSDERLKKAEAALKDNPDDPEANLVVGKVSFLKGQADKAVSHFAKCSDAFYKAIAEKEMSGAAPLEVGDAWFDGSVNVEAHILTGATATMKVDGRKEAARLRPLFVERALLWYEKAWPVLEASKRPKLRDLFHKMAGLPVVFDKPMKGGQAKGWSIPDELWESYLFQGFGHGSRTCAQILPAGKKNEAGYTGFHSIYMPASGGKIYHVVFWYFTERTDADGSLSVRFVDGSQKQVAQSGPLIATDAPWWQKFEGDFTCPAGASRIQLNFTMMAKTGVTFIDDASVEVDGKNILQNGGFEEK